MVKEVLTIVTVGLSDFGHVYVGLGRAYKPMVGVTKGDPAVVISAAAMRDWAAEHRVCFRAEVALVIGARCFVVPPNLAVATEWDFVTCPCVVRQG